MTRTTRKTALYAILLAIAVPLAGCHHNPVVPGDKEKVQIDKDLLKKCGPLGKAKSGQDTDLKDWSKETIDKYVECSTHHNKLVDVTRKAFNIPE